MSDLYAYIELAVFWFIPACFMGYLIGFGAEKKNQ